MRYYIGLPLELETRVKKLHPHLSIEESNGFEEELSIGGDKKELVRLLLALLQLDDITLDQFIKSFEEMETF